MRRRTTTLACASTKSVCCCTHAEDLEGAISAWKEALRLSPDSPDAHTNLASAYVMSKPSRPDLAIEHLQYVTQLTQNRCVADARRCRDPVQPRRGAGSVYVAPLTQASSSRALSRRTRRRRSAVSRYVARLTQRAEQNVRNCTAKLMAARLEVERKKKAGELPEEITEPK